MLKAVQSVDQSVYIPFLYFIYEKKIQLHQQNSTQIINITFKLLYMQLTYDSPKRGVVKNHLINYFHKVFLNPLLGRIRLSRQLSWVLCDQSMQKKAVDLGNVILHSLPCKLYRTFFTNRAKFKMNILADNIFNIWALFYNFNGRGFKVTIIQLILNCCKSDSTTRTTADRQWYYLCNHYRLIVSTSMSNNKITHKYV